jgi:uncharacterized membrane protein YgdD (TMEM256/DUF423 family)
MMPISFIFILGSLFLSITFITISILLNKNNKIIIARNVLMYMGLLIFSGMIYLFYTKVFSDLDIEQWHSIPIALFVIFGILFFNFVGIILSIIKIIKINFALLAYGILMVSTILTYNLMSFIEKMLDNKIGIHIPGVLLLGIIMVIENLLSYYIIKKIIKMENDVRGNYA